MLVGLGLLATAAPPEYSMRAAQSPVEAVVVKGAAACFPLGAVPDETTGVRLTRVAGWPAPVRVRLRAGDGLSTTSAPGVPHGAAELDYPLPVSVDRDHLGGEACLLGGEGKVQVLGQGGLPSVALLGARRGSWLDAVPLLSRRAAFGRGTVLGAAALPLAILAVLGSCALLVGLGARHLGRSAPIGRRTVLLLGVAGSLWGAAYAVTTPPFQAPDESEHLRYAELIVDRHTIPRSTDPLGGQVSGQLNRARQLARLGEVHFAPDRRTPWTAGEDRAMDAELATLPSDDSRDLFDQASSQPPTYYALVAAAQAAVGGSVLDGLLVGRLVSALLFGFAVMGVAVFAREAVPRAGGLVVAAVAVFAALPVTGFVGGSVNPDALLAATAAWSFAVLAMVLRRGPTLRRCLALGALVGLGVMAKLTFVGLLPMFVVAAVVLLVRGARAGTLLRDLPLLAASAGAAALVALPYFGWAILSGRGVVFGPPGTGPVPVISIRETVVYGVGLFAGEVGPIARRIPVSGPIDIWGDGLVGRLGWLDYGFPRDAMLRILNVWELLAAGAVIGLARSARARRAVPVDAVVYAVGALGIAFIIARAGLAFRLGGNGGFEQARYLIALAAVGVAGVALALRQVPRDAWRAWAAGAVLVLALAHGVAGFLLTVGRYFA